MNNKDKIYIAGCGGMLGEGFYKVFENSYHLKCTDISVNEKWISSLDFRDYDEYRRDVKEFKPTDVIIQLFANDMGNDEYYYKFTIRFYLYLL